MQANDLKVENMTAEVRQQRNIKNSSALGNGKKCRGMSTVDLWDSNYYKRISADSGVGGLEGESKQEKLKISHETACANVSKYYKQKFGDVLTYDDKDNPFIRTYLMHNPRAQEAYQYLDTVKHDSPPPKTNPNCKPNSKNRPSPSREFKNNPDITSDPISDVLFDKDRITPHHKPNPKNPNKDINSILMATSIVIQKVPGDNLFAAPTDLDGEIDQILREKAGQNLTNSDHENFEKKSENSSQDC